MFNRGYPLNTILSWVLGIALITLGAYTLTLKAEISIYKLQADSRQELLDQANEAKALRNAVLVQQNTKIQEQGDELLKMQNAGVVAQAQADIEIGKLETKINSILKEPKSTSCEQVRQKMLRYALL